MKGFTVALTGGIGSGKSVVAERFAGLGAGIVDADAIAHELTGPRGAAMQVIEQEFGRAALAADGSLDRAVMRRLVFADSVRREKLESVLHPLIRAVSSERRIAALKAGAPYVAMVIPLLVESDKTERERFDRIVVVDCPEEVQIKRVMARSGLSEAEVKAIMATQAGRQQRLAAADDVIVNDKGLTSLQAQVTALHVKYCAMAGRIRPSQ